MTGLKQVMRVTRRLGALQAIVAAALGAGSIGCASMAQTVPFEPPPKAADASTFVVYTRGGFVDYLVVLDRQRVVGVAARNSWFHLQVPPGEHDLVFINSPDLEYFLKNQRKGAVRADAKYPCKRVVARTDAAHTYYVRVRFISPATPGMEQAGKAADERVAQVEARRKDAERTGNRSMAPTGAEQQAAANQAAGAAGGAALVTLANDPDAKPPFTPEDMGWTFRGINDAKALGPEGTARLKEWDRVVLKDPGAAQALFEELRKMGPLSCADEAPAGKIEPKDHLD